MIALCFTGPSGGGKSALARETARQRSAPLLVEHDIFRELARRNGYARGRHWLDAVGVDTVLREARDATLRWIANLGTPPLVILFRQKRRETRRPSGRTAR